MTPIWGMRPVGAGFWSGSDTTPPTGGYVEERRYDRLDAPD